MSKVNKRIKALEELVLFSLFGAMMYLTAQVDLIPNFHPLAMFIAAFTVIYRAKALIPLYVYVFLEGLLGGFNLWWVPYLYVWTVLWAASMLIPRRINEITAGILIIIVTGLHGILFGVLYAPFQCYAVYGGDWGMTWLWIINGALFDTLHLIGNVTSSLLAIPLIRPITRLSGRAYPFRQITAKQ